MNTWKLKVGRFGKIRDAEIEVNPFMVFVGDNNSGKSYIMELLWGLISKSGKIIDKLEELPDFNELLNIEHLNKGKISIEVQENLVSCFNKIFSEYSSGFVKDIFNHNIPLENLTISREKYPDISFTISKINVNLPSLEEVEKESVEERNKITIYDGKEKIISILFKKETLQTKMWSSIYKRILLYLIRKDYFENYSIHYPSIFSRVASNREPIYFPASRTGFMHTYRAILGNQRSNINDYEEFEIEAEKIEKNQIAGTNLTLPTILFLEKLQKINIDMDKSEFYKDEIEFLTTNILKGTVQKNELDYFEFKPNDSSESIPLHVTSSLVAELAPILIFLKSDINPTLWIIEEIESHLHPKVQLEVARFLVRLFNKNKRIWITTHSDSVVQKINNLITLSLKKDKHDLIEKLGFNTSDLFTDTNYINLYQFENINGITQITKLPINEYGFEIPSFNDTLDKLIIETANIQEIEGSDYD